MRKIYLLLFAFTITILGFGQTEILNAPLRSAPLPAGWSATSTNFEAGGGGYLKLNSTSTLVTTSTFDASTYTSLEVKFQLAKFGSGTDGPVRIEYSLNGGSTWTNAGNSNTPTSSTYLPNTITISSVSATMKIRFNRAPSPSIIKVIRIIFLKVPKTSAIFSVFVTLLRTN